MNLEKLTPDNVIQLLQLLDGEDKEWFINLLAPLSISLLLLDAGKLMEFIKDNYASVMIEELKCDCLDINYATKILVILSMCLLILENHKKLKLIGVELKQDPKLPKHLKLLLEVKAIDLLSVIEKKVLLFLNVNKKHQIYYNLSVCSLHLYNYAQLIMISSQSRSQFQSQQKLFYLRRALTYYQVIHIPRTNSIQSIQMFELYQNLFILERFHLMFTDNLTYNNNCNYLLMTSRFDAQNRRNSFYVLPFRLFNVLNAENVFYNIEVLNDSSFDNKPRYTDKLEKEHAVKFRLVKSSLIIEASDTSMSSRSSMISTSPTSRLFELILLQAITFKVLLMYKEHLSIAVIWNELRLILHNIHELLYGAPPEVNMDLLKVLLSNYQLPQTILFILEVIVSFPSENLPINPDADDRLLGLARFLRSIFGFIYNGQKILDTHPKLRSLFMSAKDLDKDERSEISSSLFSIPEVSSTSSEASSSTSNNLSPEGLAVSVGIDGEGNNELDLDETEVLAPEVIFTSSSNITSFPLSMTPYMTMETLPADLQEQIYNDTIDPSQNPSFDINTYFSDVRRDDDVAVCEVPGLIRNRSASSNLATRFPRTSSGGNLHMSESDKNTVEYLRGGSSAVNNTLAAYTAGANDANVDAVDFNKFITPL